MNQSMRFKDESGNEITLTMVDAFDFEDTPYALFATPEDELKENEEPSIYVLKPTVENNEIVDFTMPSEEELEKVTPFIIRRFEEQASGGCSGHCSSCHGCHDDGDCDCDCDCDEDDDCGCGCGGHH